MPPSRFSPKQKRLRRAAMGCALLTLLAVLWDFLPICKRLETATLDYRYAFFNRSSQASSKVMVIDIDEQSMKLLSPHYGRWPWPRRIYKDLIEFLSAGEPSGIFFDLLFTEAQLGTSDDSLLAEASAQAGNVSHAMLLLEDASMENTRIALPPGIGERFGFQWAGLPSAALSRRVRYRDFSLPAQPYLAQIPKVHVVSVEQDRDGVYRRLPMAMSFGEYWLPSLTLSAVASTLAHPTIFGEARAIRIEGEGGERYRIPLEEDGRFRIHYYRDDLEHRPEVVSLAAVMDSAAKLQSGEVQDFSLLKVNPTELKGKVILVGCSAAGCEDLKVAPVSPALPGVLLHATAVSNILKGDFLKEAPYGLQLLIGLLSLVLVYLCVLLLENIWAKTVIPTAALGGYLGVSIFLFRAEGIWLELARPLVLASVALFDSLTYLIFVESKEKQQIKDALTKYLPPTVAEGLIASGQDPRAEVGSRKELSVLFSDIRGFTSLSESMEAERLVGILNEYLGRMTSIVFEELGTLDKFIGDAIMAFWGAPVADPNHSLSSVKCALKMQAALQELNREWASQGFSELRMGVGINTGEVIVGNIGSEKRLDYTVIGDNVNLASRLEGLTKQYGVGILIGPGTQKSISNSVICRPVDLVRVQGKSQCVKIFEPLAESSAPGAQALEVLAGLTERAFQEYQRGQFDSALMSFEELGPKDPLGQVFAARCRELMKQPPKDWDGVFVAKSK